MKNARHGWPRLTPTDPTVLSWAVWILRIAIGAVFIMSGFAKCIDVWGFVYKIEEYLTVWDMPQPRSLVLTAAVGLSVSELLLGAMMLFGAYRRATVWVMLAMMSVMLPLTAYIWLENPVSDCGCFGDMLVISNSATFWKNVVITLGLCWLALANDKVRGLYQPYSQWVPAVSTVIYGTVLCLVGYTIQPMLDFRSFPVGTMLAPETDGDEEDSDEVFEFIYSKDGKTATFSEDELPDSTWTFVERRLVSGSVSEATELNVYDESGDNVTAEAINSEGPQLIIVIPQGERADVSFTYMINVLERYMTARGGSLVEFASFANEEQAEEWKDMSMARYPIYRAESTTLKELSRGDMSAVLLRDGRIVWKLALGAIDIDDESLLSDSVDIADTLNVPLRNWLVYLTAGLIVIYLIVLGIDKSTTLFKPKKMTAIDKK